jgi:transposase InsO family protein
MFGNGADNFGPLTLQLVDDEVHAGWVSRSAPPRLVLLLPQAKLLDRKVFYTLVEARVLIGAWRRHYNTVRPPSALGPRPPAPEAIVPPSPLAS